CPSALRPGLACRVEGPLGAGLALGSRARLGSREQHCFGGGDHLSELVRAAFPHLYDARHTLPPRLLSPGRSPYHLTARHPHTLSYADRGQYFSRSGRTLHVLGGGAYKLRTNLVRSLAGSARRRLLGKDHRGIGARVEMAWVGVNERRRRAVSRSSLKVAVTV